MRIHATGALVADLLKNKLWLQEYGGIDPLTNADILSPPIEIDVFFTAKTTIARDANGQEKACTMLIVSNHPIEAGDRLSPSHDMPENQTYRVVSGRPCYDIDATIDHYEAVL